MGILKRWFVVGPLGFILGAFFGSPVRKMWEERGLSPAQKQNIEAFEKAVEQMRADMLSKSPKGYSIDSEVNSDGGLNLTSGYAS